MVIGRGQRRKRIAPHDSIAIGPHSILSRRGAVAQSAPMFRGVHVHCPHRTCLMRSIIGLQRYPDARTVLMPPGALRGPRSQSLCRHDPAHCRQFELGYAAPLFRSALGEIDRDYFVIANRREGEAHDAVCHPRRGGPPETRNCTFDTCFPSGRRRCTCCGGRGIVSRKLGRIIIGLVRFTR